MPPPFSDREPSSLPDEKEIKADFDAVDEYFADNDDEEDALSGGELLEEVVTVESEWKKDPGFLEKLIPTLERESRKRTFNRVIHALAERHPLRKDELMKLLVETGREEKKEKTTTTTTRHEEL